MSIEQVLYERFGHRSFRQGQKEIIENVLKGSDVFAMLPTGTGKSVCYQLPGYMLNGMIVIVSPLISLMEDQVEQLRRNGERRVCAFHSGLPYQKRRTILQHIKEYRFFYVSPETLQSNTLLEALSTTMISLFVIDEAHCISQWGHEFRTDYLKLSSVCEQLGRPPMLALTATATDNVRTDVINQLKLHSPSEHIYSVDRPNIAFDIKIADSAKDKIDLLIEYVKFINGPGIIYTSSRKVAENLTETLKRHNVDNVAFYHGGMETDDRLLIQKQFIYDELDVICCTNAFGMGINKPNIRYVIHYHYPSNMESYLQEIGRAGRDGQQSLAVLLYHSDDDYIPEMMIGSDLPNEQELSHLLTILDSTEVDYEGFKNGLQHLGISETAERFLLYQFNQYLNKHGSVDLADWKETVTALINERMKDKYQKVSHMKHWIHTDQCKREMILKEFSETILQKPEICCNDCGLSIEQFRSSSQHSSTYDEFDWEKELAHVFHQENGHV